MHFSIDLNLSCRPDRIDLPRSSPRARFSPAVHVEPKRRMVGRSSSMRWAWRATREPSRRVRRDGRGRRRACRSRSLVRHRESLRLQRAEVSESPHFSRRGERHIVSELVRAPRLTKPTEMATNARCPAARAPIARAHRRSPARLASGARVASTPRPLGASERGRAERARRVRPRAVGDHTPSTSAVPDRPIVDLQGKTVLVVGLGCVRSPPVERPPLRVRLTHPREWARAPSDVRSNLSNLPAPSPEPNPAESPVAPPRDSPSRAAPTSSASTSTPNARRSRAIPTPSSPRASSPPPPRFERSAASFAPSSGPTATPPSPRLTSSSSHRACPHAASGGGGARGGSRGDFLRTRVRVGERARERPDRGGDWHQRQIHRLHVRGQLMRACGARPFVGGNLGDPLSDCALAFELAGTAAGTDRHDACVVECSSYQLEHPGSLRFDAACVLNLTPDHVERHGSVEAYAAAKARAFAWVRGEGSLAALPLGGAATGPVDPAAPTGEPRTRERIGTSSALRC